MLQSEREGWGQSQGEKMMGIEGTGGFPKQIRVLLPGARGMLHTPQALTNSYYTGPSPDETIHTIPYHSSPFTEHLLCARLSEVP